MVDHHPRWMNPGWSTTILPWERIMVRRSNSSMRLTVREKNFGPFDGWTVPDGPDGPSVDGSLLLYFRSLFPHIPTGKSWWLQRWSIVGLFFNSSWPINSEKSNFFSELWQSFYYGNILQEFNWRRINPKKIIANNGSRRFGDRKLMELYRK